MVHTHTPASQAGKKIRFFSSLSVLGNWISQCLCVNLDICQIYLSSELIRFEFHNFFFWFQNQILIKSFYYSIPNIYDICEYRQEIRTFWKWFDRMFFETFEFRMIRILDHYSVCCHLLLYLFIDQPTEQWKNIYQ